MLASDDGAAASRRHARGRTGRWVAAGAAVGAIALVLVAALALTDPARRRGGAASDAAPARRSATRANAAHAATLGRTSSSDANDDGRAGYLAARRRRSPRDAPLAAARVVPGAPRVGDANEMVTLVDLDDLDEETGEKSEAQRGWRKGDERWLKPSTIEAHVHAADDELTNEFLDELPTRVPAHAIAEVKWAKFHEATDRVLPPADVGSYAGEEIDWTVVREKKAAAAGAAESPAKRNERIRLIVENERLAERARMDAAYGSDAPSGSFILAPICLAVVSSVVVIAVLLVRNRGNEGRRVYDGREEGAIDREKGSSREGEMGKDDRLLRGSEGDSRRSGGSETDVLEGASDRASDAERGEGARDERGAVTHGGGGGETNNRRSMDGAESSSVADSRSFADDSHSYGLSNFPSYGATRSSAANLRGMMSGRGFGSRNTAMDRLIDDSRSDVAPSEAPSTVFEINPPRWMARMFGARESGNTTVTAGAPEEGNTVDARGNSSRGESVFSAADFSDAEAYATAMRRGTKSYPSYPRGKQMPGQTPGRPRSSSNAAAAAADGAGRAVATSAHASAFAAPPPPHLQSRSAGGGGGAAAAAGAGKPPRTPFGAGHAMAGAGRPVPPDRPPRIVKSTTRFL